MNVDLDLVAIGRVSVDLYGQQIGSRLEDVSSFAKAVGGSPTNVAIGASRLGLKTALVSRVGDEPMGHFVLEQLAREGVDARGVRIDRQRLTSLVLLSVRDEHTFPLIFYRENCADSALNEDDIDADLIASARALLVSGTHFSLPAAGEAQRRAIAVAKAHGRRVILDIDYRPNLWGIGGHGAGESRYGRSSRATDTLASVLPDCDLIVGTEEELHVASGVEDTLEAIRRIRRLSSGVIVCKRGAKGCVVYEGAIPDALEDGIVAPGFDVEVYNVLGAGDAFLAGFLRGYLRGETHAASARLGNACGAIAVSRLLCSPEFPTLRELEYYLEHGSAHRALRNDARLNHVHWATTRRAGPATLIVLAIDDEARLEQLATRLGAASDRVDRFRSLALEAVVRVADGRAEFGVLSSARLGGAPMQEALQRGLWCARAVERTDTGPLELANTASLGTQLLAWPSAITVAVQCRYHIEDPAPMREALERELLRVAAICRAQQRELLLTVIASRERERGEHSAARTLSRLYKLGICPDWWALAPQPSADAWRSSEVVIAENDAFCRGMLLASGDTGLETTDDFVQSQARNPLVRGVIAGRTMFASAAEAWLTGGLSDEAAVDDIAQRLTTLTDMWSFAREAALGNVARSAR